MACTTWRVKSGLLIAGSMLLYGRANKERVGRMEESPLVATRRGARVLKRIERAFIWDFPSQVFVVLSLALL